MGLFRRKRRADEDEFMARFHGMVTGLTHIHGPEISEKVASLERDYGPSCPMPNLTAYSNSRGTSWERPLTLNDAQRFFSEVDAAISFDRAAVEAAILADLTDALRRSSGEPDPSVTARIDGLIADARAMIQEERAEPEPDLGYIAEVEAKLAEMERYREAKIERYRSGNLHENSTENGVE